MDVHYADYGNGIHSPQFFVLADHKVKVMFLVQFESLCDTHSTQTLVVCIRGTLSLYDTITDGLAMLEEFNLFEYGPTRTHSGILAVWA